MDLDFPTGHVGYVTIIGRPNVGKSTLINRLMDYHLTAVSPKPQTTRRHWQAVYCDDDSQIIFIDTPGIHKTKNKLGENMFHTIRQQVDNADIVLCIVAPSKMHGEEEELLLELLNKTNNKIVLAVNKVDINSAEDINELKQYFRDNLEGKEYQELEISALNNDGVDKLIPLLKSNLEVGPFFYDRDHFTDATERQISSELIQEAVFLSFDKEVPHAMTVVIDSWKEDEKKLKLDATIHIDHERLKKIIIGKNGAKINEVKRLAIQKLRENIEKRIDLKLFVKVNPDWRNSKDFLNAQGFLE